MNIIDISIVVASLLVAIPYIYNLSGGSAISLREQLPASYFQPGSWGVSMILGLMVTITLTFFTSI